VTPATNTKTVTISLPSGQRITTIENGANSTMPQPKKPPSISTEKSDNINDPIKKPQEVRQFDIDRRIYNIHTIR